MVQVIYRGTRAGWYTPLCGGNSLCTCYFPFSLDIDEVRWRKEGLGIAFPLCICMEWTHKLYRFPLESTGASVLYLNDKKWVCFTTLMYWLVSFDFELNSLQVSQYLWICLCLFLKRLYPGSLFYSSWCFSLYQLLRDSPLCLYGSSSLLCGQPALCSGNQFSSSGCPPAR